MLKSKLETNFKLIQNSWPHFIALYRRMQLSRLGLEDAGHYLQSFCLANKLTSESLGPK